MPQPPYVRSVSPGQNATDVKVDTAITADIVDGANPLDVFSIQMKLNGASVTPTWTQNGNVTTVTYQPASPLAYKATNTVTLSFGDGTVSVTNTWQFVTRPGDQKPSITGQWDFDSGDLSATIGLSLEYMGGTNGPTVAQTQFGTTTGFGIPDIDGVPAKVMRYGGAINNQIGFIMKHGAVPNGGPTATKVNQWTLIMDIMIPNAANQPWFSFVQINNLANTDDGDLFANFNGGTAGLGISGQYPKVPPVIAGHWHRIVFAVDTTTAISKYVDGVKTADQTGWSGNGFDARHAMFPTALLFADEDGESQPAFVNSVQFRNYKMSDAGIALLGGPSADGIPTVSGQWDFENADFTAIIGSDLLPRPNFDPMFFTTFQTDTIDGQTANVMGFTPDTSDLADSGYILYHGTLANGGGSRVNQYTLIMDIKFPSSSTGFRSLWQVETNNPTTSDGELFVNPAGGIGISGSYQGNVTADTWHRVAFTFDLTKRQLGKYIDGANVLTGPVGAAPLGTGPYQYLSASSGIVDQRWSLDNNAILFGDNDGELAASFLNSLQFRATVLSAAQIASLGGPSASGIPANIPAPPRLSFSLSTFGDFSISWPANYTGFTLQCSPTLGPSANWVAVPGVVNNSVDVPATEHSKFYRLRK